MDKSKYIALSGAFDPVHIGHINMIKDAARAYGRVVIFLNTDEWLMRKKGFVFMPYRERYCIMKQIFGVAKVIKARDDDNTVCESLRCNRDFIDYFGNGGDRVETNTPELDVCDELGIEAIFNLGGGKIQSSSELVRNAQQNK